MKRVMLIYGSIAGAITIGTAIVGIALSRGEGAPPSMWLGYLVMILAFSLIFVGIKRYRDRELGGVIRFGRAFLLGLGITAVASVVYVGAWEVYLAATGHDFIDEYAAAVLAAEEEAGATAEKLAAMRTQMEGLKEAYANPLLRMLITLTEIFPVGLLVSLIAAIALRTRGGAPRAERTAAPAT